MHEHWCPRCGEDWGHESRQCNEKRERHCEECEGEVKFEEEW